MTREWKPGDVALVDYGHGYERMMRDYSGWLSQSTEVSDTNDEVLATRPLAVIDPEDREKVERLTKHLPIDWNLFQPDDPDLGEGSVDAMQAALREFADPRQPKPEEPTGLGAVVVDAEGKRYVRCSEGRERWHCPDDDTGASDTYYDRISAVRVLSQGVQAGDPQ